MQLPVITNLLLNSTLAEHLQFVFVGFGIVLLVLAILALITGAIGLVFIKIEKEEAPPSKPPQGNQKTDDTTAAIVSAAAHSVLGKSSRVQKITPQK